MLIMRVNQAPTTARVPVPLQLQIRAHIDKIFVYEWKNLEFCGCVDAWARIVIR